MNLVLAYGLKFMWSMMNVLQFVIFAGEWKINLDPFAKTLTEQLKKLALFEFIDSEAAINFVKENILGQEPEPESVDGT